MDSETHASTTPSADSDPATSPGAAAPGIVCPYCGDQTPDRPRCGSCQGLLDPLSRQATQNAMGPWFVRDSLQPHRPGCSYETVTMMIARGKLTLDSVVRGPTTGQFWYPARRVPGIANRLGVCHACQQRVEGGMHCHACHASFEVEGDRQTLGLLPIRLIPGVTEAASPPRPRVEGAAAGVIAAQDAEAGSIARRLEREAQSRRTRSALLGVTIGAALVTGVGLFTWSNRATGIGARLEQRAGAESIPQRPRETDATPSGEQTTAGRSEIERPSAEAPAVPAPHRDVSQDPETRPLDESAAADETGSRELAILRRSRLP